MFTPAERAVKTELTLDVSSKWMMTSILRKMEDKLNFERMEDGLNFRVNGN
jgi:hypothetical protein